MAEPPIKIARIHRPEMGVTIHYEVHDYHVDFKVREGTLQPDGSVVYTYFPDSASEPTWEFEQAERYFDGTVKWDGCSHFNFGEGEENPGYMHLCGAAAFRQLGEALRECFWIAANEMPRFDPECAGLKALGEIVPPAMPPVVLTPKSERTNLS